MNDTRFSQILQEYDPAIRRYLNSRCHNPDDVEDLYQECVCAIFEALPRFAERSSVSTWVHGICRNVLSNYVYYRKRDSDLRGRLPGGETTHDSEDLLHIRLLIDRLPGLLQRLYKLYYVEGRSVKEISVILGKAEGTIKYLLHRLRNELREML